jgi:hypothetical protein
MSTTWVYQPVLPATAQLQAGGGGNTGQIKVWDGASWVAKPMKVWTGASWEIKPVKFYDGATWVTTPY